jgi:hypothetical protein
MILPTLSRTRLENHLPSRRENSTILWDSLGGSLVRRRESRVRFKPQLLPVGEFSLSSNRLVLLQLLFHGISPSRECFHPILLTTTDGPRMILRKASAALAAGCCMVIKPSPETPLSVLALVNLATQAGFPKGTLSVLTTSLENTPSLSEALVRHPLIKKVTFTGSVSGRNFIVSFCG